MHLKRDRLETGTAHAADIILTVLGRDVNPSVFIPALFPPVAACSSRGPLRRLRFHPPFRSILPRASRRL